MAVGCEVAAERRAAFGAVLVVIGLGAWLAAGPSGCFLTTTGLGAGGGGTTTVSSTGSATSSSSSGMGGGSATSSSSSGMGGGSATASSSSSSSGCSSASQCGTSGPCETWACVGNACQETQVSPGMACLGQSGVCDATGTCVTCFTSGSTVAGCAAGDYCFMDACASCTDGMKDGDETGVDCGGSHCPACDGQTCGMGSDCSSMHCVGGVCCNASCTGPCALSCATGTCEYVPRGEEVTSCAAPSTCDGAGNCVPLGTQPADGGTLLADGQVCMSNAQCFNGTCAAVFCKLKNGDVCKDDLDCASARCAQGACQPCGGPQDCATMVCSNGVCGLPQQAFCAHDGDCAKGACNVNECAFASGAACTANSDCVWLNCVAGTCASSCAGPCKHAAGDECKQGSQCASGVCSFTGLFQRCM